MDHLEISDLLISKGAGINEKTEKGDTALIIGIFFNIISLKRLNSQHRLTETRKPPNFY